MKKTEAFHLTRAMILMALHVNEPLSCEDLFIYLDRKTDGSIGKNSSYIHPHLMAMEDEGFVEIIRGRDSSGIRRNCYKVTNGGESLFECMQMTKQQLKQGNSCYIEKSEAFTRKDLQSVLSFRQMFLLSARQGITSVPLVVDLIGQILGKSKKPLLAGSGKCVEVALKQKLIASIPNKDDHFSLHGYYGITEAGEKFIREGEKTELKLLNPSL